MSVFFGIIGFILASFFAFYIPGRVVLGHSKSFSGWRLHCLSLAIGIVLFAWQGFVVGSLHIRLLTYGYIGLFIIVYILKKYYPTHLKFPHVHIDIPSVALITIGVLAQTFSYIRMGWMTSQGIIITAHNDPDHIWHASLVNELVKRYPPHDPAMAGVILKDYHYWFNLITADLIRVFHLPLFTTQFIGMYILGSILFGLLVYILASYLYPSKLFIRLCLFFIYFIGNAAGWYMLYVSHVFDWNVSSLIVDGTKFMDSPAYAYAIIVGITGVIFLLQKKLSWIQVVIIALCFGSLMELKIYVGLSLFAGFGVFAFVALLKRNFKTAIAFILAVILGLIIFLPATSKDGGLAYIPFDIPRDFINQFKLGHIDWQLRWIIYQQHHNTLRIIQYGLMMSGIYFLIQYGILLSGFIPLPSTVKRFGSILFLIYPSIIMSIVMGLLFYQKVGGANIWEFFLAGVPFLCLLVANIITTIVERKNMFFQYTILVIIFIITIPQWFISVSTYISNEFFTPFHGLSTAEVTSFAYIKNHTPKDSVVMILGEKSYVAYSSVASIYTNRDLYLSGEGVRQQKTPLILHRENIVKEIETLSDPLTIAQLLHLEHVNYLYVYNGFYPAISGDKNNLVKQFSNRIATIYKVEK